MGANSLITPAIGLVFWSTIAFSLLLFLLVKFAWKPILGAINERENSIADSLNAAELAKSQLTSLQAENEKLLDEARKERDKILKDAQNVANTIIAEAKDKASTEANQLLESAKISINAEKMNALTQIQNTIGTFSVQIAEQIVRKNLSSDDAQQNLVKEYLSDLKLN